MKGDDYMATIPTQIRIDATVKDQASRLFADLGMDMSGAVNIFLRQCILHGGLPFSVTLPRYNKETLAAMAEAKKVAEDSSIPGYTTIKDLKEALDKD
jgi:DNA-damage-inducible protein J